MAKKKNWIKKAFANSHGQFKAKADAAGMSTEAYAAHVASSPKASGKAKKQANLAKIGMKFSGKKKKK
jgi:hypothetical protein